jgi:hypothetical protein
MANPRPLSIVKLKTLENDTVKTFDLNARDRFIYWGEIAQDPTRCVVEGIYCGKRIPYLSPDLFEEVDPTDF